MIVFNGKLLEASKAIQSLKGLQGQDHFYVLNDRPKRVTLCCSMAWWRAVLKPYIDLGNDIVMN